MSNSRSSKYSVGQRLIATRPYGRNKETDEVVVVSVGRKLVTVAPASQPETTFTRKFDMETGSEQLRGGYKGGTLYTEQEWADLARSKELRVRLRSLGVEWAAGGTAFRDANCDQLHAIIDILDPDGNTA